MYPPKSEAQQYVGMDPPQLYPSHVATGYPSSPGIHPHAHQPLHQLPPHAVTSQWSSGLCDCTRDPCNCCLTCWCPCIAFGQMAEIVDEGHPSCAVSGLTYGALLFFVGCACCYSCFYRTKMRSKFGLEENSCGDCLTHFFCECCALCQEYRELKHRGVDPAIGWGGNLHKQQQQQGIRMSAPVGQTMY